MEKAHQHIQEVLNGNTKAFKPIVEAFQPMIYTICLKVLKDAPKAEDATQEAFVKAFKKLGSFKGKSSIKTWLYQIAYRTAIDHQRKVVHLADYDQGSMTKERADSSLNQQAILEKSQRNEWLHRGLDQLNAEQSLTVTLFYMEEKSVQEIVAVTGWSTSKVKIQLFRARENLRKILRSSKIRHYD